MIPQIFFEVLTMYHQYFLRSSSYWQHNTVLNANLRLSLPSILFQKAFIVEFWCFVSFLRQKLEFRRVKRKWTTFTRQERISHAFLRIIFLEISWRPVISFFKTPIRFFRDKWLLLESSVFSLSSSWRKFDL